jgi:plastocyanin
MRRIVLTAAIAALALVPLSGCGDDDDDSGGGGGTTAPAASPGSAAGTSGASGTTAGGGGGGGGTGASIDITEFAFPAETQVAAGQPLSVTNDTGAAHTVTADDDSFNEEVGPGETIELVVSEPGSYPYHCNFHSNMTGVLEVG